MLNLESLLRITAASVARAMQFSAWGWCDNPEFGHTLKRFARLSIHEDGEPCPTLGNFRCDVEQETYSCSGGEERQKRCKKVGICLAGLFFPHRHHFANHF